MKNLKRLLILCFVVLGLVFTSSTAIACNCGCVDTKCQTKTECCCKACKCGCQNCKKCTCKDCKCNETYNCIKNKKCKCKDNCSCKK